MRIDLIVGLQPDLVKAAPVAGELRDRRPDWHVRMIHTGQPYDERVSDVFFKQLGLPEPEINLGIESGSRTFQTAHIMLALEGVFRRERPDLAVVFGDGSSTVAAAVAAVQLHIPVAHVEAGLRSDERDTRDEQNRILTDAISEVLFVTERGAEQNLRNEGIPAEKVHFVGSTIIDTLLKRRLAARALHAAEVFGLRQGHYVVVTLQRAANVDAGRLRSLVYALQSLADYFDVMFLAPPRVVEALHEQGLWDDADRRGRLRIIQPLPYLDFLSLLDSAGAVLTDSGGTQEEAVVLGVPCVTLRRTTDRPATLYGGGNRLAGDDAHLAVRYAREAIERGKGFAPIPEGWDGKAASRIVDVIERQIAPRLLANGSLVGL